MQRILQVVTSLDRGGIDLWLLAVLRGLDRRHHQMDFLVLDAKEGELAGEVRRLGGRVTVARNPRNPWHARRTMVGLLRTDGPYDVVHSHVHGYGGFVTWLAARAGVPERIVHSHSDMRAVEAGAGWRRRLYLGAMKWLIRRYASRRIGVSSGAAADLFGADWETLGHSVVLPCGIDLAPFAQPIDRPAIRQGLGLPEDAVVIGHVGRFFWAKNHPFLLEIAAQAFAREPRARLLLVGDGPLLGEIEARARQAGLSDRTVFAGARADVAALMSAMDVFVFPSNYEGLPLAPLEAQASGLPCLLSDAVTTALDVLPQRIRRLAIGEPPARWAETALELARQPRPLPHETLPPLLQSAFALETSVGRMLGIYRSLADARARSSSRRSMASASAGASRTGPG